MQQRATRFRIQIYCDLLVTKTVTTGNYGTVMCTTIAYYAFSSVILKVAKCYFAQIVHAISYCHRLHVVHRDLKPENVVFFEKQGVVKLTDFGFSNRFQPGKKLNTSCGSLAYSAPEILLGDEYDAPAVGKSEELTRRLYSTPVVIIKVR